MSQGQRDKWGPDQGGAWGPCEKVGLLLADEGSCQWVSNRALVRSNCSCRHGDGGFEGSTPRQRRRLELLVITELLVIADKNQQGLLNRQKWGEQSLG